MLLDHHTSNVDDKSIQHWEGHTSQETTVRIYIKQINSMTEQAGKILSNFAMKSCVCAHLAPFLDEAEKWRNLLNVDVMINVNPMCS